jgi:hypothetical protein
MVTEPIIINNINTMLDEQIKILKEIQVLLNKLHNVYETALDGLESSKQKALYEIGKPFGEPTSSGSNDDSVVSVSTTSSVVYEDDNIIIH